MPRRRLQLLAMLGPGILVAATGLGAGDIATAGFAGSRLGYAILWAAVLGAFIKFVVNEGLARWQLATGETFLEGALYRFGRPVQWFFLIYLLFWSFFVGSALMSACGVAAHAIFPVFRNPNTAKIVFGIIHSVAAVCLIWVGGFRWFERFMGVLLFIMFASVLSTALLIAPEWPAVVKGLLVPRIPAATDGARWTLALMGGVGGTLTMLCYGYWIREQGRTGPEFLRTSRFDLGVSYAVTGLFGVCMVIIGTGLDLEAGAGTGLVIKLSQRLGETLGTWARWVFLIGAWSAFVSSLIGVWQAVPYLFADFWQLFTNNRTGAGAGARREYTIDTKSRVYRGYLLALAFIPMIGLQFNFVRVQQAYSMFGAVVMPLTALALLIMNTRRDWVGKAHRNRPITIIVLLGILAFFAYAAWIAIRTRGAEQVVS